MGWDFAGVVESIGAGVTRFRSGDTVFGCLGPPTGSVAELLVADADDPWLAPLPASLDMADAAALPMVGLTAMTVERALARDGVIFVIGASGGIGAFLVPMLARAGMTVLGTGAASEAERMRAAGVQVYADHREVGAAEFVREHAPDGADAVIDLINQFDALQASAQLLRPGGQLLSTLFGPDAADMARSDIELTYVRNDAQDGDLDRIADLIIGGTVTPVPKQLVALGEAPGALDRMIGGFPGKVVVDLLPVR